MVKTFKELINTSEFREKIKKCAEAMVFYENGGGALKFFRYLEAILKKFSEIEKEQPEFFRESQEMIIKTKIIALNSLNESEVLNLIEKNLDLFFEMPTLDITERFERFIVSRFPDLDKRDLFKKKTINLLQNLEIKLTSQSFKNEKNEIIIPTIKNWLADYNRKFGFVPADKIKQIEYLEKMTTNFSSQEKEKVRTLFKFYEYLKTSSSTMEGLEESFPFSPDGKTLKIYREGRLETIDPKIIKMVEEVLSKWPKSEDTGLKPPEPTSSLEQKYLEESKDKNLENSK